MYRVFWFEFEISCLGCKVVIYGVMNFVFMRAIFFYIFCCPVQLELY